MAMDGPGRVDHSSQSHTSAVSSTQPIKTSGFKDGVKVDVVSSPERHVGTQEKPDNFNPREIHDRFPRKLTPKESFKLSLLQLGLSFLWGKAKTHVVDKALNLLATTSRSQDTALASKLEHMLAQKAPMTDSQKARFEEIRGDFFLDEDLQNEEEPHNNASNTSQGRLLFEGMDDDIDLQPVPEALDTDELVQDLSETAEDIFALYEMKNYNRALTLFADNLMNASHTKIPKDKLQAFAEAIDIDQEELVDNFADVLNRTVVSRQHSHDTLKSHMAMAKAASRLYPQNESVQEALDNIRYRMQ